MPHKPYWFRQIALIRRWIEAVGEPVLDRRAIEAVFQVSQTEAQRILKRAGGWRLGGALVVTRWQLLDWLGGQAPAAEEEQDRRGRLEEKLAAARRDLVGRQVAIHPLPEAESIAGLPAGIKLRPGRLEIDFFGTEDLVKHLFALAQAVQHDYVRFQEICES